MNCWYLKAFTTQNGLLPDLSGYGYMILTQRVKIITLNPRILNVSVKKHKNTLTYEAMSVAELIKPEHNIIQSTMNYQPFGRIDIVSLLSVQPTKILYLQ